MSKPDIGPAPQQLIAAACEEDLEQYGDSFRGVGYTKSPAEASERYAVMLGVIREPGAPLSVLDLGCGLAHLADFIDASSTYKQVRYVGLDISAKYLAAARRRHPHREFLELDVLERDTDLPEFDYVILNGLFNFRGSISRHAMVEYWQRLLTVAYRHSGRGLAFNVMSTLVDWERDDLFHLPFETMSAFVWTNLTRHFVIRHDYRAFEYTTYLYRLPLTSR